MADYAVANPPYGPNSRVPDAMQRATLLRKAGTHEDDEANARMMDPGSAAHHAAIAARCAASGARSQSGARVQRANDDVQLHVGEFISPEMVVAPFAAQLFRLR